MLTIPERNQALREYTAGRAPRDIGKIFGVTGQCISMLVHRAGLPPQRVRPPKKVILTPVEERYRQRQIERNQQMRAFTANKRAAGCPTKAESTLAAHYDAMARLALIPDDTRSLTARFMGDPLPGRSALDQRQGSHE